MIRSSLCDYSDVNILSKETITIVNTAASDTVKNNTNKKVIFKFCAPFTDCIMEINNAQLDDVKKIDIVMPMYHSKEYRDS